MIKIRVGGIGSGKTIGMIREIAEKKDDSLTNFKLYNVPHYKRLAVNDLVRIRKYKGKTRYLVNFDYWRKVIKKGRPFNIYLDELHNVANSRTGGRRLNIALNLWISQIRKILQGNENNDIQITTQRPMSIDIGWRDLCHFWIVCNKIILPIDIKTELYNGKKIDLPMVVVTEKWFDNLDDCRFYMQTGQGKPLKKVKFVANNYYKFYNTAEIVDFGTKYL